jgi:hypothetical protein
MIFRARHRIGLLLLLINFTHLSRPYARPARSSSIDGIVKDPSGAVLPNVDVVVTDLKTQVKTHATTDGTGFYRVFNLPIGDYQLEFHRNKFRPYSRTGLQLSVSQVAEVNATLELGDVRSELASLSSFRLRGGATVGVLLFQIST